MLRRAIDITVAAQREAMRTMRAGMYEYEIEALFTAAFRRTGGDGPAFVSIIGSGPNSTQYHYNANDRQMQAGDVVVMDVGGRSGGHAPPLGPAPPGRRPGAPGQTPPPCIARAGQPPRP